MINISCWLAHRTFSESSWTSPWLFCLLLFRAVEQRDTETFSWTIFAILIFNSLLRNKHSYVLAYHNILCLGIQQHWSADFLLKFNGLKITKNKANSLITFQTQRRILHWMYEKRVSVECCDKEQRKRWRK